MNHPVARVHCIGDFSTAGQQYIRDLQDANVVEAQFKSFEEFASTVTDPHEPAILVFENNPPSKGLIQRIRSGGRKCFIIVIGRAFTKEDVAFAMENRVYTVLEGIKPGPKVPPMFEKLSATQEHHVQFHRLVHTVKSMLLQVNEGTPDPVFLNELKTAVGKLESVHFGDEFLGQSTGSQESGITFYRSQLFSDAITTIEDLERTGELHVRGSLPNEEGRVQFLQGKIVSAKCGGVHGMKALYRMFLWDEPRFLFARMNSHEVKVDEEISDSLRVICDRGEGLKARFEKIRNQVPPGDLSVELVPTALHTGTKLTHDEFSTLASVIEFHEVSQILDYNPLPDVVVFESLIGLRRANLLTVN